MYLPAPRSIRARLWAALALLALASIGTGAVTWVSLGRVDKRLQDLHQQTLVRVAQALDLSKRSTDLATSAPYMLNQRSNYLINREGERLIAALDEVRASWPAAGLGADALLTDTATEEATGNISIAVRRISAAVKDLVSASGTLEVQQAGLRDINRALGRMRNEAETQSSGIGTRDIDRVTWWTLQSMTADALNAAHSGNLIGVGEARRRYVRKLHQLTPQARMPSGRMPVELQDRQAEFLSDLDAIVSGPDGLFERRRRELSANLAAQNALFRIRFDAGQISALAGAYAHNAEQILADERQRSSAAIRLSKAVVVTIALASLVLALMSAVYVSRYVTFNIAKVSAAMVRLAKGDRSGDLVGKSLHNDEIGDLFRSYRSFRANALRLDRSNRQLHQRNALFQKVFTNISDGVAITDATGKVTAENPWFARILQIPEAGSHQVTLNERLANSPFADDPAILNLQRSHRGDCELQNAEGQIIELRASRLPDEGRVWLCQDVTERRNLANRLQQADRIETLGKLAGDTAHDFANILTAINTHTHLLEKGGTGAGTALGAIQSAVEYGTSLTQRLLAFARKQHLTPEVVDLNQLVTGLTDLISIGLKPDVELEICCGDTPLYVLADPGQLESTVLNLVLNSSHAITGPGQINVTLARGNAGEAVLSVKDTGSGMTKDVLKRAVEPFFSTRSGDGGTGLGLSIVYGFIKQTGGDIQIDSTPGKGTEVVLTLPLSEPAALDNTGFSGRTILMVEDDDAARAHGCRLLKEMGFRVSQASDSRSAQSAIHAQKFDFLMTDIELGDPVNGWDIALSFLDANPDAAALVVSGRMPDAPPVSLAGNLRLRCLPKPLTRELLTAALAQKTEPAQ